MWKWTTSDRVEIEVSKMTDTHLRNSIRMVERWSQDCPPWRDKNYVRVAKRNLVKEAKRRPGFLWV
jgi:hypothetical protein